ncbi:MULTISPECIES: hypothetical protein [unclassified Gilliamella]|uniref:hypothetical protein n=1 Tax=unclassified Gilliamella TaxID=2685620 RepID=UPI00159EC19C|nr:hypothetical protein [Gilliamella apicola]
MTNKDFVNSKQTDKFNKDYKLNKSEQIYAFFCTLILSFGGLFMLFHWMLHIATD